MLADSRMRFQCLMFFCANGVKWLKYVEPRVFLSFYHCPQGHLMEEVNESVE